MAFDQNSILSQGVEPANLTYFATLFRSSSLTRGRGMVSLHPTFSIGTHPMYAATLEVSRTSLAYNAVLWKQKSTEARKLCQR